MGDRDRYRELLQKLESTLGDLAQRGIDLKTIPLGPEYDLALDKIKETNQALQNNLQEFSQIDKLAANLSRSDLEHGQKMIARVIDMLRQADPLR